MNSTVSVTSFGLPFRSNGVVARRCSAPSPLHPSGNSTGNPDTRTSYDMFGPGVVDKYPVGAVVNGWKKVSHPWPFGPQIWWEKVKQ